jgi:hypothetical protein
MPPGWDRRRQAASDDERGGEDLLQLHGLLGQPGSRLLPGLAQGAPSDFVSPRRAPRSSAQPSSLSTGRRRAGPERRSRLATTTSSSCVIPTRSLESRRITSMSSGIAGRLLRDGVRGGVQPGRAPAGHRQRRRHGAVVGRGDRPTPRRAADRDNGAGAAEQGRRTPPTPHPRLAGQKYEAARRADGGAR